MRSPSRLSVVTWMFFSLSCALQEVGAVADAPASRPNILLIMSDDHSQRAISAYGEDMVVTPNLDRLADEGAIFHNSFVTNSICTPSRAVLLTGTFSHRNGVLGNGDMFDGHQPTLPGILQQQGYETAVVGKWHLGSEPVGFDHWQILIGQGEYYSPRFLTAEGTVQYDGAYVTDKVTDLALEFLQSRDREKPFMMFYHHKAPHRNWMPPVEELGPGKAAPVPVPASFDDDYAGRPAAKAADMRIADMFLSYDLKLRPGDYGTETGSGGGRGQEQAVSEARAYWQDAYARMTPEQQMAWDRFYDRVNARYHEVKDDPGARARWMYQRYLHDYLATVRAVDRNIGRVLDYLDGAGLYGNTIVIYTSDQGFYLGEHGWYDKRFMYEESMRTPLLMRYPAAIAAGTQVDQLVQNLDLAPTLLDFSGSEIPAAMQGLSVKKLVGGNRSGAWRDALYYHYYQYPGWHLVNPHYGIRTATHKLIHFYTMDHWELYDLEQDPGELHNRYDSPAYAQVRTRLHERLGQLREQYGDSTGAMDESQAD